MADIADFFVSFLLKLFFLQYFVCVHMYVGLKRRILN